MGWLQESDVDFYILSAVKESAYDIAEDWKEELEREDDPVHIGVYKIAEGPVKGILPLIR